MPIDFYVTAAGDEAERHVPLPLQLHEKLQEILRFAEFPQLKRIKGYSDAVEFSLSDLPTLRSEIERLTDCAISEELLAFLLQLGALLDSAIQKRTTVYTSPPD